MRRALAMAAAAVLVAAVGVAAFLIARPGSTQTDTALPAPAGVDPARTYVVDGRAYPCLTANSVSLRARVVGTTDAVFVVDGTEVATNRALGLRIPGQNLDEPPEVSAVMPQSATAIRCDADGVHRIEVVTDHPDGCELLAQPVATFTEGKNHSMSEATARLPTGVCTLTVRS